jgi:hypothetical protein
MGPFILLCNFLLSPVTYIGQNVGNMLISDVKLLPLAQPQNVYGG